MDPVGTDDEGNIYWYFYGTRLYSEHGKKKKNTATNDSIKGKGSRGRGKTKDSSGKGGRKRKEEQLQEAESPAVPDSPDWKVACSTSEEWEELIDNLRQSKKPDTKRLCNYLNDELIPDVLYLIQQKVAN